MAKTPKTTERKQKLKVFRTPVGFHDAYVAAPSRKAALEAWGADSNLFASGIAEQVTDPTLMEGPLASPGKVIRKARGSADEHFAELERAAPRKKKSTAKEPKGAGVVTLKPKKPKPKPKRDALDAAEATLAKTEKKQRKKLEEIDRQLQALEKKRRELQRKQEAERDALVEKRDMARVEYQKALRDWDG